MVQPHEVHAKPRQPAGGDRGHLVCGECILSNEIRSPEADRCAPSRNAKCPRTTGTGQAVLAGAGFSFKNERSMPAPSGLFGVAYGYQSDVSVCSTRGRRIHTPRSVRLGEHDRRYRQTTTLPTMFGERGFDLAPTLALARGHVVGVVRRTPTGRSPRASPALRLPTANLLAIHTGKIDERRGPSSSSRCRERNVAAPASNPERTIAPRCSGTPERHDLHRHAPSRCARSLSDECVERDAVRALATLRAVPAH